MTVGALLLFAVPFIAAAQSLSPQQRLARDIYRELVEINTVTATGDTAKAAEAMAARLRSAGFPPADVRVFTPAPRKGNLVARLRGTGAKKPILLLAHIDVVEAKREDWSTDPFKLVEQDGYFYARGSGDDKFMAAAFVANLIRYRQEGYRPERAIIVALSTDEELGDAIARLSAKPPYNAQMRTTCVATMLSGGHAPNALPQLARANVNCRVLPAEPIVEVTATLKRVLADDAIEVTPAGDFGSVGPSPL